MAATLTRRTMRRVRLGGRHTIRTVRRHRVAMAIAAVAAALTVGTAAVAAQDLPPIGWGPPVAHGQPHEAMPGPMQGGFPEHQWGPHRN